MGSAPTARERASRADDEVWLDHVALRPAAKEWLAPVRRLTIGSLYGQPQIRALPSLISLTRLRRLEVGSMKGLESLGPLLDAPQLEELMLIRAASLAPADAGRIARHPTLHTFDWFAEDVPDRVWLPVVERIDKPKTRSLHTHEWFGERF